MKIDLKNVNLLILRRSNLAAEPMPNLTGMVVQFGDGTFTWNLRDTINYELDRGRLADVRRGDQTPVDVSFSGKYEYIQEYGADHASHLSLFEALDGALLNDLVDGPGAPSPWLTAGSGATAGIETEPWLDCAPYCVALELHNDLRRECPNLTGRFLEATLFRYFRAESHAMDVKAGTIAVTGKCNITDPLVQRVTDFPYLVDDLPSPLDGWPADPRG